MSSTGVLSLLDPAGLTRLFIYFSSIFFYFRLFSPAVGHGGAPRGLL